VPLVKTAALLAECLADELHLVVAHPMTLAEVRQIGDVALLRYIINAEVASRVSAV
jgi:hypothetical protein